MVKAVKSETTFRNTLWAFNPRNVRSTFNPRVAKWIDPGIPFTPTVSETIQTPAGLDIETPAGETLETP